MHSWQEFHQGDGVSSSVRHSRRHTVSVSLYPVVIDEAEFCSLDVGGAGFVPCKVYIFLL